MGKMVKIFTKKDFVLYKIDDNKYEIIFNNRFGYQKPNYLPVFHYDWRSRAWVVKIEGVSILVRQNPCFELINESRGYTILDSIHTNDIVIDAGSSSGFISCYFAKKVGKLDKVVCLEPDDRACRLLELNVKVNDINNLVTVRTALYSKCTRIFIDLEGVGASKLSEMPKNSTVEIETIDLHTPINEFSLNEENIKLIKLDIEGSELEVMDDLICFVEKNAGTIVCIASYHERDGMPSYRTIEEKCKN